jgi:non-canonical (house-cleaning) NTP pyrophosphatase
MEKQTEKGILKYRMPNIVEIYDLLDKSGITSGESSTLKLKKNIIEAMGAMVEFSPMYESYEELLNDTDNMIFAISEIADEILEKAFGAFKKKTA